MSNDKRSPVDPMVREAAEVARTDPNAAYDMLRTAETKAPKLFDLYDQFDKGTKGLPTIEKGLSAEIDKVRNEPGVPIAKLNKLHNALAEAADAAEKARKLWGDVLQDFEA